MKARTTSRLPVHPVQEFGSPEMSGTAPQACPVDSRVAVDAAPLESVSR